MNNLITQIKTKFLENRKNIIWIAFFVILFWTDNSFANTEEWAKKTTEIFSTIIALWNTAFAIWAIIIWILTQFVWLFLQPGWTTGSIIWLDWHLKQLWVLVSNIVYFIFAFLIIIVAFMNIIWKWDNNYQLKTALPHFIVWILIVPFSWFIIQFVLSISALLTVSALSLPYDLFWKWAWNIFDSTKVNTECTINMDTMMNWLTQTWWTKWTTEAKASDYWFNCTWPEKSLSELMSNWSSIFSIMYVYTYWIMKIQDLDKLTAEQTKYTSSLWTVAANLIFNGVFILRFLILIIALAIAMFSRWVVLWLFTIFSPIFWLLYFFNWKAPKALEKISFKDFLWVAMVPVYVWLALSFWLVFTFVTTQWLTANKIDWANTETASLEKDSINVWWMKLTIEWRALWSYKEAASGWNKNVWEAIAGWTADFLAQLIVDLIALAVLWMAVMAALKSSSITANVVQPIASFGENIWKTAMKLPQYAPVFPGWQSMRSMQQVWNIPWSILETKTSERANTMRPTFENMFWWKGVDPTKIQEIKNILKDWINTTDEMNQIQTKMKSMVNEYWRSNSQVQSLEKEIAEKLAKADLWRIWLDSLKIKQDSLYKDWKVDQNELAKAIMNSRDWTPETTSYINALTSGQLSDSTNQNENNTERSKVNWWNATINITNNSINKIKIDKLTEWIMTPKEVSDLYTAEKWNFTESALKEELKKIWVNDNEFSKIKTQIEEHWKDFFKPEPKTE